MKRSLRILCYALLHKVLIRVKEYNKDNVGDKSYILCPNHTSDADGPVLWTSFDNIRIMAKKECFNNKMLGSLLNKIDVVSVDRDRHSGKEMWEAAAYLEDKSTNKIFMMFPQGTISDINKNALARIKEGAFIIAAISNTPIIPVFMEQPRFFRRSRIVYGKEMPIKAEDVFTTMVKAGDRTRVKFNREKLDELKDEWQKEILKLQQLAIDLEKKPIREPKLNYKHAHNNDGDGITKKLKRKPISTVNSKCAG